VSWTAASISDLSGRLALVTGASSGLGLETARALVARGATVVMGCRSRRRGEEARQALLASPAAGSDPAIPWGGLDLLDLDLADLASVRTAAAAVADRYGRLDLLINTPV
jgi:protochlorophyllide reductase